MFFWKKNKINKKFLGAKTVDVPKTAQKTIPFQEAYENGLFLNYDGSYSLIFSFENIDYSLYRDGESNTEDKPTARSKKENRVIKLIKDVFWI